MNACNLVRIHSELGLQIYTEHVTYHMDKLTSRFMPR